MKNKLTKQEREVLNNPTSFIIGLRKAHHKHIVKI